MKYIQSKYISNLKVVDEGDYWNTMDESLLKEKMDYLDSRLAMVGDILNAHTTDFSNAKNHGELVDKIEMILNKYGFHKK